MQGHKDNKNDFLLAQSPAHQNFSFSTRNTQKLERTTQVNNNTGLKVGYHHPPSPRKSSNALQKESKSLCGVSTRYKVTTLLMQT